MSTTPATPATEEKKDLISDKEFDSMFGGGSSPTTNAFSLGQPKDPIAELDKEDDEPGDDDPNNPPARTEDAEEILDSLDNSEEEEEDEPVIPGTFVEGIQELVDKGLIQLFVNEDGTLEKELSEYTKEDIVEMLEQNFNRHIEMTAETAPLQVFKGLPQSVQDVVLFAMNGGKDEKSLKNIFLQLAQVQDTLELNPTKLEDARKIVRQFHQAEGILSAEQIEDEIRDLEDREKIIDYATKRKEVLDAKQAAILKGKLAEQENKKKNKIALDKQYADSVGSVLKNETVSDINFDLEHRKELYLGLVEKRYQNENGEAVNELQHLLHEKQFGENKDMSAVVLAYSILKDPKAVINALETKLRKEITSGVTKEIKDGNKRQIGSGTPASASTPPASKKQPGVKRKPTTVFTVKQQ